MFLGLVTASLLYALKEGVDLFTNSVFMLSKPITLPDLKFYPHKWPKA